MYLVPRLIGISTYVLILILFYALLRRSGCRSAKKIINAYIVVLAMIGYFFSPMIGADLYRLTPLLHIYASLSFKQLFKIHMLSSLTPGAVLYYWLIGKLGNDRLLPCISTFISFYFCFAIMKDSMCCDNENGKNTACNIFHFMAHGFLMAAISNNRTMISVSIISWAIYQELVHQKPMWKNGLHYLAAISIHVMGQFIFMIYVAFLIVNGGRSTKEKIQRSIIGVALAAILLIVFRSYVTKFIEKALRYIEGARTGVAYSYFWEGLISAMSIAITVYFLVLIPKIRRKLKWMGFASDNKIDELVKFTWIVVAINVFCGVIGEFSSYQRTSIVLTIFDMPLGMYILMESRKCSKDQLVRNNYSILSGIMLFIECSRGFLCSLKFF